MYEALFELMADATASATAKLRALATHACDALAVSFVEIRLDGIGGASAGTRPDLKTACWPIGRGESPVGEIEIGGTADGIDPARLEPILRCAQTLHRLQAGYIDNLTGLYNRRRLDMELAALAVEDISVAVAMMDIDHFKRVNDTHGHEGGDAVLREFSARMASALPPDAFASRYGGEEFCVIWKGLDEDAGAQAVERLREAISRDPVAFKRTEIRITSSAGVAAGPGRKVRHLIGSADQALYASKQGGRDQTTRASATSRHACARIFRRRMRRVYPRPLLDLSWAGPRVAGLDAATRKVVHIDYFGGAFPVETIGHDCLSFVRVEGRTFFVPRDHPGLRAGGGGGESIPAADLPDLRRVQYDAKLRRIYIIERSGRDVFWSDTGLTEFHRVDFPDDAAPRAVTAILPLGSGILALDALSRRMVVFDRARLTVRQVWNLPACGYEIFLAYLAEMKLILTGGASGLRMISFDGQVVDEYDQPGLSAYSHPRVGVVLSSLDETLVLK